MGAESLGWGDAVRGEIGGWIKPDKLIPGATVGVVAPAGPVDRARLETGEAQLREMGFSVRRGTHLLESRAYLAGCDADRARDLGDMISDPGIDAIFFARGGFGCTRLIPHLRTRQLRENPKALVGFSDITALHLWALRNGVITFHGPVVAGQWPWTTECSQSLFSALTQTAPPGEIPEPEDGPKRSCIRPGKAHGRIIGGNLSMLLASLGTDYELDSRGAILFIEEVGEPAYRIDRMFTQLAHAGKLRGISGMVLGDFCSCPPFGDRGYIEIVREICEAWDIPCFRGLATGHGRQRLTLPLGVRAEMDAGRQSLRILEGAVQ